MEATLREAFRPIIHVWKKEPASRRDCHGRRLRRLGSTSCPAFFAPGSGIDEDPVTGSSHTALGPYWAERLGKTEFTAFQASEARRSAARETVPVTA